VIHERFGNVLSEQNKFEPAATEYAARLKIDSEMLASEPTNPARKLTCAFTRFLVGDALVKVAGRRREGIDLMTTAVGELHALRDAGQLNPDVLAGMREREAKLKEHIARGR
jgi:hypothetical protein